MEEINTNNYSFYKNKNITEVGWEWDHNSLFSNPYKRTLRVFDLFFSC